MPDPNTCEATHIFYFGSGGGDFERLRDRLGEQGVRLHGFRTMAGMMLAAGLWAAPVLVLEPAALPPGRTPRLLLDRLQDACGLRPLLVCLGSNSDCTGDDEAAAEAAFSIPYDIPLLSTTLITLVRSNASGGRRVLVVGDSPVEQGIMSRVLHREQIHTRRMGSGEDAAAAVAVFRPHLVLLDLDTSAQSGRDLAVRIRDCDGCDNLPIVFLSGESPLEHRVHALRIGGDDYLVKPVSTATLIDTVQSRIGVGDSRPVPARDGIKLMEWDGFRRRLHRALREGGEPNPGEALLAIRLDRASGSGRAGAGSASVESEILGLGKLGERAAWAGPQELIVWLRRDSAEQIEEAAEEIRAALSPLAPGQGVVSIGIASLKDRADGAETMISRAQAARAQAHGLGGHRVMQHVCTVETVMPDDPEVTQNLDENLYPLLRRAIADQGGFRLVYQPILPLRRSGRHRYEVFLRLRTPSGAIIPPLTFLPMADHHGLLPDLDRWVLSNALSVLRQERDAGRGTLLLIHQTADSLLAPDWLDWVRDEILRLDLVRQRPVLELGVAAMLDHEALLADLLPAIDRLGIDICLGGVGDDPAVQSLLQRHKVDFVKLERSLMAPGDKTALRSVVRAAHKRRIKVIASGIEDPEAIGRAWSGGADYIQGNFIRFPEESLDFNFEDAPLAPA